MKFFWSVVAGVVSGALGLVLGRAAYERYFEKISTKALPPSKAPVELPTSREEMEDLRGFVDDCMLELNLTIEGDVPIDDDDAEDAIEDLRLCVLDKLYPTTKFPPQGTVHPTVWQAYSIVGSMARNAIYDLMDAADDEAINLPSTGTGSGQLTPESSGGLTSSGPSQGITSVPQQSPFQGGVGGP